ncbi:hypothetical protein MLD38_013141 [Melastoma candidum]|uniref:Uncharacterized protein n=1 Tax=Melastoma candidum TaxID=119954 RepID=A0ACB9R9R7_9MYRT|nr:hypothetical protein MLD38_013141 [Melastoma candidum]
MAATCAVRHLRRTIPIPTYPGHLARLLHSVPAVVQSSSYVDKRPAAERLGEDVLDLDDGRSLFGSFSTSRLVRSAASLHAAAVGPVVDVGTWVMGSKVIMGPGLLRDAVLWGVRRTFYDQFCAGEDMPEVVRSVRRVNALGLRAMLDYALEDVEDGASCDRNLEEFLTTIDATRTLPPSSVSFVVVKISAICSLELLRRVSDLLRWHHRDPSFRLPWKMDALPIFADSSPLYHTLQKPEPLTPEEELDLAAAHERLALLCRGCRDSNVPLAIDAENTLIQPAIDYFTYSAELTFNKGDQPVVYGTMQAYLKDAWDRLQQASEAAEKAGIKLGVKLVRGAYMSSESTIAHSSGHESPIHNTIRETHACYDNCASYMLDKVANRSSAVVLATHNVESAKLAAAKARDLGMTARKGWQGFEFAQLYGMADSLSFGLRNAGFTVNKYMPFGRVDMVIPYLLRRAEENRGLLSASSLDRQLMRKELWRRLKGSAIL